MRANTEAFFLGPAGETIALTRKGNSWKATMTGAGDWSGSAIRGSVRELIATDPSRARAYSASVWAFRCVDIRSRKTSDLMNRAQLVDKNTQKPAPKDHPYYEALKWAYQTFQQDIYYEFMTNRLIFGESFIEKISKTMDFAGMRLLMGPGGIRVLPSVAVEPRIDMGRITGYDVITEEGYQTLFELNDIAFYRTYNPSDTLRGLAPMDVVLDSVNVDMYIVRYSKQYYANGARPGLVFTPKELDLNDADMESIKEAITKQLKGVGNFFRPVFLNYAMDATVYPQQSLEDQSFLTAEQRERISAGFSVPVGMVTFADQRYQFSSEQRSSFYEEVVIPDVNDIARFINYNVLPFFDPEGQYELKPNSTEILALLGDFERKATIVNDLFDRGAITQNERRLMLSMNEMDGGDFISLPAGRMFLTLEQLELVNSAMSMPNMLEAISGYTHSPGDSDNPAPNPARNANTKALPAPPQNGVLDELRAWEKKAINKGAKTDFQCYYTKTEIADDIRAALMGANGAEEIHGVFDGVRETLTPELAMKAIQATRLEFEGELEQLLRAINTMNRRDFGQRLRTMIRRYADRAIRDGLREGGVSIGETDRLAEDEQSFVDGWVSDQSQYVTNLGASIFVDQTVTEAQLDNKPIQWFNRSIMPVYEQGRLFADRNGMYEWIYGQTEEHCKSCSKAVGQIHRLRDWHNANIVPRSDLLECAEGGFCDCHLVKSVERARGNLSSIPTF